MQGPRPGLVGLYLLAASGHISIALSLKPSRLLWNSPRPSANIDLTEY
jgi:hypothetical protein